MAPTCSYLGHIFIQNRCHDIVDSMPLAYQPIEVSYCTCPKQEMQGARSRVGCHLYQFSTRPNFPSWHFRFRSPSAVIHAPTIGFRCCSRCGASNGLLYATSSSPSNWNSSLGSSLIVVCYHRVKVVIPSVHFFDEVLRQSGLNSDNGKGLIAFEVFILFFDQL